MCAAPTPRAAVAELRGLAWLTEAAWCGWCRLPKLHVISVGVRDGSAGVDDADASMEADDGAQADEKEFDIEVDDDPSHAVAIDASQVPVCVTFAQVGGRSVVDARQNEELCASSRMMVFVNRSGNICAVETSGTGSISTASLHQSLAVRGRVNARGHRRRAGSSADTSHSPTTCTAGVLTHRCPTFAGRRKHRWWLDCPCRCGTGGGYFEAAVGCTGWRVGSGCGR